MATKNKKRHSIDSDHNEKKSLINIIGYRYLPFWPIFVITILACLLIGWVYLRYQVPVYSANASILLKDQDKGLDGSKVLEALDVFGSKKIVDNEIEVLKSRTLMRNVVKDLGLYAQVYASGKVRKDLAYTISPVEFIALNPDSIKLSPAANKKNIYIPFRYLRNEGAIVLNGKKYPMNVPIRLPFGVFRINPNSKLIKETSLPLYLQILPVKKVAESILQHLVVAATSKQSTVIAIKLTDPVPKRAEDILNDLIKVYNKAGVDDKNAIAANTLAFVEERLKIITAELSKSEENLQQFRTQKNVVDMSEEGKVFLNSVQKNDEQLSETRIQLSVLNQIEKYIKRNGKSGTTPAPATLGLTDPVLIELLNRLYEAELQLDRLQKTNGENSPAVAAVRSQIDRLKPTLLDNVQNLKQDLLATEQRLLTEGNKFNILLKGVPQKERELVDISRQQAVKNNIYTFLLQKREETALSYASAVADSRLVDNAEAGDRPVAPVPSLVYFISFLVGVSLGILFVIVREQLNSQVLFVSEIEQATDASIIAEINQEEANDVIVIREGKRTTTAEQFRSLRTSLDFIATKYPKKVILFTSSISGEGKSFMAINLGVSVSLTGKKVVIMEFDLRRPKISTVLGIEQVPGISNYLAGQVEYEQIIRPLPDFPYVNIVPAGTIPPNPTELIVNGRLKPLMERLKEDYDYIMIDSAPIGLVTDAKLLNVYADVCLYMVRHKYTPKNYLQMIDNMYRNNDFNNLQLVFNGLTARGVLGYSYGQGYGRGYGYGNGYGYGDGNGYTQDEPAAKRSWIKKLLDNSRRSS